jgi:hypothetical protein
MSVCIDIVVLFISKNNHLLQKNIDSVLHAAVPSGYNTETAFMLATQRPAVSYI